MSLFDDREEEDQFRALTAAWILAALRSAGDGRSAAVIAKESLADVDAVLKAVERPAQEQRRPNLVLECRDCGANLAFDADLTPSRTGEGSRLRVHPHACSEANE